MQNFLSALIICSITMSVAAIIYILLAPLLLKKYEAKWLYYGWLVIVIGFVIPFRPQFDFTFFKVDLPAIQPEGVWSTGVRNFVMGAGSDMNEVLNASTISIYTIISSIWLVGMVVVIGYHILRHLHFMKLVNRWSEDVCDEQILNDLLVLREGMGISKRVYLRQCSLITSPMIVGFVTPTILLPVNRFSDKELTFILAHELVHYKRKDVAYKSLVLLATAIHWFNPVVYVMSRSIALQCELSCDAEVMRNKEEDARRQYCETIIGVIQQQSKLKTALSTHFYGGKENMKNRILAIMDPSKKKGGIAIFFGMVVICVAVFTAVDNGKAANHIMVDKAVQIEPFKGFTESKHIVEVDVDSMVSGEGVSLGQYRLEEGDMITYDITSEGKGNLNLRFMKTVKYDRDGGYLGNVGFTGNRQWKEKEYPTIVPSSLAGTYYLFISNYEGESLENIKGTVEIAVPVD